MESGLNFNNVSFTDSGQLRFSGLLSGIDFQSAIDSIIAARRIPAVQIEQKIQTNIDKIATFNEFQLLSQNFRDSLDGLRGATFFGANDVFENKLAFSTSRSSAAAPPGYTPSAAGDVLGANVASNAVAGQHVVEVTNLAKSHQIRSDAFTSNNTDLNTLGFTMGTFDVNGQTVTLAAGDTLLDLRDKINNLNAGATPTNVSASIITVSPTQHFLTLTSTKTGTDNVINLGAGTATSDSLGLTNAGVIKNEIQAAENAILNVDGLNGIIRQSNTIDDILEGVTLDIFKAEVNTEIVIDVDNDLNGVKTSLIDFVDTYNALRDFITDQRTEKIRVEGSTETEFGPLGFDTTLRAITQKLDELVGLVIPGATDGFEGLGQIGMTINSAFRLEIDDDVLDNKLLTGLSDVKKIFAFDFSSTDSRLLHINHTGATVAPVDGGGNPVPLFVNIAGTDAGANVTGGNISTTAAAGTATDGSATISGKALTGTDLFTPDAEGLSLVFSGAAGLGPITDIQITYTRGVADQLFTFFDDLTKFDGTIPTQITTLTQQNSDFQTDVDQIDERLELQRQKLIERFTATEAALARMQSLQDTIAQFRAQSEAS